MSSEEKTAWTTLLVTTGAYAAYLILLFGRAAAVPLPKTPYVDLMLWAIGGSIVASILVNIAWSIARSIRDPRNIDKKDRRDREIFIYGEHVGSWLLVLGALAALVMAWLMLDWFWIANVIYLGFVLQTILSSITKVIAYRKGFQSW